jgi:hypothetical protein
LIKKLPFSKEILRLLPHKGILLSISPTFNEQL